MIVTKVDYNSELMTINYVVSSFGEDDFDGIMSYINVWYRGAKRFVLA